MSEPTEKELLEKALALAEELKAEVEELKRTIADMAAALAVLTKKDEEARAFATRIEEIARWSSEGGR
jgi:anti-sigma factor RsiW